MQAWVISGEIAVRVFNGIYVWAHFPLVAAIGLILFNLFPTAPPRLLFWSYGLIDTVAAWAAVILDRHGDRVWNLVVPLSLRRAQA